MQKLVQSTLALALWLAFSAQTHAVVFNFEELSGDIDVVDFDARLEVSTLGGVSVDLEVSPFPSLFPTAYSISPNVVSLSIDVSHPGSSFSFFFDQDGFLPAVGGDQIFSFSFNPVTLSGGIEFNASEAGVSIFGFPLPPAGDRLWPLQFPNDAVPDDAFPIIGRFVQQTALSVSEPAAMGLLMFGLVAIGFRAARRST